MKKLLILSALASLITFNAAALVGDNQGDVTMGGDFNFPQNSKLYVEGTKVVHEDRLYECKAFPFSGYCSQWSPSANQYEPGVGTAWDMAWTDVTPKKDGVDYHVAFPELLNLYVSGVIVENNGEAYQCNAGQAGGYCSQWSEGSNQYEPGLGEAWNMAWTHLGTAGNLIDTQAK